MAFYGSSFTFDGISCEEYGMMIFDIDSTSQGDPVFASAGSIIEDRVARRYRALHYGTTLKEPLEFKLVFGSPREDRILDRWDINAISTWLTGHQQYKWLVIQQPDMQTWRYRCLISGLKPITVGNLPAAFSCTVTCDSPFAYSYPEEHLIEVNGSRTEILVNESSLNGYYSPSLRIDLAAGATMKIVNHSDKDRAFEMTAFDQDTTIEIDGENQVITCSSDIENPYEHFNMRFLRLVRGENELEFSGNGAVTIMCEFPVNPGG